MYLPRASTCPAVCGNVCDSCHCHQKLLFLWVIVKSHIQCAIFSYWLRQEPKLAVLVYDAAISLPLAEQGRCKADIWVQWGEAYGHSPWLQDTAESAATNGWNHTVSINASQESHTWMISLAGKTVLGMLLSWKKICWCKWLCVAVDSIWTGITAFPTALRLWDEVSGQVMNISSSAVHQYTC